MNYPAAHRMKSSSNRAAIAAFLGSATEFYDLVIYGTAAALVFGKVFFADVTPTLGITLAFGTFASGYLVRPLGGILFGYIGDRYGRRVALLLTISLMGTSTLLVGLLPTQSVAGHLAPVLLVFLRLCQGLAVGGELGGAILISVEHAPANRRGFYGSFSTAGGQGGGLLATAAFGLVTLLPNDQFMSWGWRIPFLFSAVIVAVGLFVRYGIDETPDFKAMSGDTRKKGSLSEVFRLHFSKVVGVTLVWIGIQAGWYVVTVFSLSYATSYLGMNRTVILWAISGSSIFVMLMNPIWGALSDRFGRPRLIILGLLLDGILLFAYFAALQTRDIVLICVAMAAVTGFGHAAVNGITPAYFAECFPANVRYAATSLGMQLAAVIGGLTPLVSLGLAQTKWGLWGIATVVLVLTIIGSMSVLFVLPKTRERLGADHDTKGIAQGGDNLASTAVDRPVAL
jgi:MHS family shikimate/dehydroshikimate transporter-like MFS transporter